MEREELFAKVKEIIVDQMACNPDDITESTNLIEDLDADSLDLLQLLTEFEDQFDISIEDEAFEKVKTIGDALDQIRSLI